MSASLNCTQKPGENQTLNHLLLPKKKCPCPIGPICGPPNSCDGRQGVNWTLLRCSLNVFVIVFVFVFVFGVVYNWSHWRPPLIHVMGGRGSTGHFCVVSQHFSPFSHSWIIERESFHYFRESWQNAFNFMLLKIVKGLSSFFLNFDPLVNGVQFLRLLKQKQKEGVLSDFSKAKLRPTELELKCKS